MSQESDRTISSVLMSLLLLIGGVITLSSGVSYMGNPDISEIVAALDIVAGILLLVGCVCLIVGHRPILWKVTLSSLIVGAIAGIGMFTVSILSGVLIVVICAAMIFWLHTNAIRPFFRV